MAMNAIYLNLLKSVLAHARPGDESRRLRTVALGYPDLIATANEVRSVFPSLKDDAFVVRQDAAQIAMRHGAKGALAAVLDSDVLFKSLALDVDYIDVAPERGIERQVDLNEPLPADMVSRYDLAIDTGTLEHCFNVGQAFKNVAEMMAVGGVILQAAPLNRYNHGFWNFSPTAYHDFYSENGFELLYLKGWAGGLSGQFQEFGVDPVGGFRNAPENAALLCVCQKKEQRPVRWPTQFKYRASQKHPNENTTA